MPRLRRLRRDVAAYGQGQRRYDLLTMQWRRKGEEMSALDSELRNFEVRVEDARKAMNGVNYCRYLRHAREYLTRMCVQYDSIDSSVRNALPGGVLPDSAFQNEVPSGGVLPEDEE